MPIGVKEFVSNPTKERLDELTAALPSDLRPQTSTLETLCRAFYAFQKDPSRQNTDELLAVLPSLDAFGRNAVALAVFLSEPSVQHSLNVRLELTLKQRRDSDLKTIRPSKRPTVEYSAKELSFEPLPSTAAIVPITRQKIVRINTDVDVAVRAKRAPRTLEQANALAPYLYLTENEARRIAVRLMNRLNKELFGHAARRKHDPQRLTALVCHHDRGTRRHLHLLLALPPDVTLPRFRNALTRSCRTEPFIYRTTRRTPLERVNNLAGSIRYNANDFKTLSRNAILYINTHNPNEQSPRTENSNETEHRASAHRDRVAADDGHRLRAPDAERTSRPGTTCQPRGAERQQLPPQAVAECP
jgi:hypothetical protein